MSRAIRFFYDNESYYTHFYSIIYKYHTTLRWFRNDDHSLLPIYLLFIFFFLQLGNWQPIHFSENDAKFNWIANKLLADEWLHSPMPIEYFAVYELNAIVDEYMQTWNIYWWQRSRKRLAQILEILCAKMNFGELQERLIHRLFLLFEIKRPAKSFFFHTIPVRCGWMDVCVNFVWFNVNFEWKLQKLILCFKPKN